MKQMRLNSKKLQNTKQGFTLVELMLSMTFVGLLLVAIAVITMNIIAIYQKGVTIKTINEVGRELTEEMTTSINSAPAVDVVGLCNALVYSDRADPATISNVNNCIGDMAFDYVFQQNTGVEDGKPIQYSGVFCTGNYSYIWNTHYEDSQKLSLKYLDKATNSVAEVSGFRLLKVDDKTSRVCSAVHNGTDAEGKSSATRNYSASSLRRGLEIDITKLAVSGLNNPVSKPEQGFLEISDIDLDLYELNIFPIEQDNLSMRTYMSGTFVIATPRGNPSVTRSENYCDVDNPDSLSGDLNYCAINQFNFAARTAGIAH